MSNGVKIALLAVIAIGLGINAYLMIDNDDSNVVKSRQMETANTGKAQQSEVKKKSAVDKANETFDPMAEQKIEQASNQPKTKIEFAEYEHDFGTINEGDQVEHVFTFTNTGDEPLILEKCKGSCGCTVPECPKKPLAPGESGEIPVVFNSKGKPNMQTKRVTVTGNTDPVQTILTIKAQVTPAPKDEKVKG